MITKQNMDLMNELMSELSAMNRRVEESNISKTDKELIKSTLSDSIMMIFALQTNKLTQTKQLAERSIES